MLGRDRRAAQLGLADRALLGGVARARGARSASRAGPAARRGGRRGRCRGRSRPSPSAQLTITPRRVRRRARPTTSRSTPAPLVVGEQRARRAPRSRRCRARAARPPSSSSGCRRSSSRALEQLDERRPGHARGLHELEQHVLGEHAPAPPVAAVEPLVDDGDRHRQHDQAREQRGQHRVARPERADQEVARRRRARARATPTRGRDHEPARALHRAADYPGEMTALTDRVRDRARRAAQPRRARAARRDRQLVRAAAGAPLRRRPRRLRDGLELRASTTATRGRCRELLRIDPRERDGGPVAIQLFGADPDVMRSAAATVAAAGADLIDINMGCPVPKVCRTGAGAALLADGDRAVALARAAAQGSGLPVTVKLRSGRRAGDRDGIALAHRLVARGRRGGDHRAPARRRPSPTAAAPTTRSSPSWSHARRARDPQRRPRQRRGGPRRLRADRRRRRDARARRARQPLAVRGGARPRATGRPAPREVLAELDWVIAGASEHLGVERAGRYLRRFYPWYVERLGLPRARGARARRGAGHGRVVRRGARAARRGPCRRSPP